MEFNATFLVSIISFLLFVEIMNRIFYAPITRIVEERQRLLDQNYDEAKNFDEEANKILKERANRLGEADNQARKLISDKIDAENNLGKNLTDKASRDSFEKIQAGKNLLEQEREAVEKELSGRVVGLAEEIVSKVMGVEVKIK